MTCKNFIFEITQTGRMTILALNEELARQEADSYSPEDADEVLDTTLELVGIEDADEMDQEFCRAWYPEEETPASEDVRVAE